MAQPVFLLFGDRAPTRYVAEKRKGFVKRLFEWSTWQSTGYDRWEWMEGWTRAICLLESSGREADRCKALKILEDLGILETYIAEGFHNVVSYLARDGHGCKQLAWAELRLRSMVDERLPDVIELE
ncbi:hypothetical protein CABS01_16807 [Colletotrichum abscissum]|uniref:Uncharacterized protein n=1 Tax=Colletotrichum abscissum TaxID=1671311 RepID=A0A9Q0AY85_9PEZI|nr:uncharacterized protein CABS01_16807 [Colletotrichum abscissum]KAI3530645.1 hypothetical protein CABS02_14448 [Colletotrichum abscissum]KAK1511065.1 hypothetical protein CABS01_16807 [Colletotrichum abscissum]